jgi:hypothetical protein
LQRIVRGKGAPSEVLKANPEWYERMNEGECIADQIRVDPFKKCAYKLNASESRSGFQPFSVHQIVRKYSVNNTSYTGRRFVSPIESYPHGYIAPPVAYQNQLEAWVTVEEYPGVFVSNQGRIAQDGVLVESSINEGNYCMAFGRLIHRWVAEAFLPNPEGKSYVDHIIPGMQNRTDNRAVNLRWATPSENAANHALRKDNTSGAKGIRANPSGTFTVRIGSKGLGTYGTMEEAIRVRDRFDQEKNGQFARK